MKEGTTGHFDPNGPKIALESVASGFLPQHQSVTLLQSKHLCIYLYTFYTPLPPKNETQMVQASSCLGPLLRPTLNMRVPY